MTKRYFTLESSPYNRGYFTISIDYEGLGFPHTAGSFGVLPARFLGLSYAQYLRMCRDEFGAIVNGKNKKWIVPYFKDDEGAKALLSLLNAAANFVVKYYDNDNYEKKLNWLKENHKYLYDRMAKK